MDTLPNIPITLREESPINTKGRGQVSKLLVRSAFESQEWIDRIVTNPNAELHRKKMNKTINDVKAEKHKFADKMKKNDPTINFKKTSSPKSAETNPLAATPSPADQAQQQSDQGTAVQSDQIQTAPNTSPAPRRSKRVKISQEQADQPEELGPSSASESNTSQRQQPLEWQATEPGQQNLQAPQDGSRDDGFADAGQGEETTAWSMEGGSQQSDPAFVSPGIPQAYAVTGGGHGTDTPDGQPAYAQLGPLALDPNPFNVAGPIHDYGFGIYGPADPGFHGQLPGGWAGLRPIGPSEGQDRGEDQPNQEDQAEDRDSVHHDG